MAVKVSQDVLEGLEAARDSGEYNMFDFNGVQVWLSDNDYYATVVWLEENKKDYGRGIFEGFEAS